MDLNKVYAAVNTLKEFCESYESDICIGCPFIGEYGCELSMIPAGYKKCEVENMKSEQVNHPAHYQQAGRRECIEEMRLVFGDAAVKQWCIMTAYKYRYRTGNKDGNSADQDNRKAEWYLDYAEEMQREP